MSAPEDPPQNSSKSLGTPIPLAQDSSVAFAVPDSHHAVFGNAMVASPAGNLVACVEVKNYSEDNRYLVFLRSQDRGNTWEKVCEKPWVTAHLFPYNNVLYLFTQLTPGQGVWVSTSMDEGRSWSSPLEVVGNSQGRSFLGGHSGVVVKDGWLYCANSNEAKEMGVVACDLSKGLLDPGAWIESNLAGMPIPDALVAGNFDDGLGAVLMRTLEGNVVDVHGRTLVIARACINRYGTQNIAAVYELKNESGKITLTFRQLYPLPGGQNRFHIAWDEPSEMFWMASTYATNSQDLIHAAERFPDYQPSPWHPLREDRRFLMLSYSLDALNWFQAGCIARAEKMNQAFNSPSMVVDGEDMLILSRTSREAGNFHDSDLATFHRVHAFRSLAMDLKPRI